jgi:hypothetical protein
LFPADYYQDLRKKYKKAIKAFIFTAARRQPRSVGLGNSTGDETTWREAHDEPHAKIRDPPMEEVKARATLPTKRGAAPLAMDSNLFRSRYNLFCVDVPLPAGHASIHNIKSAVVKDVPCNAPNYARYELHMHLYRPTY